MTSREWRESKGPCAIPSCERLYMARGYCQGHYKRLLKYGDPLGRPEERTKKQVAPKPPREPKYKLCTSHTGYVAGCALCQAGARLRNRAYLSIPENAERKRELRGVRPRSLEQPRSVESRAQAKARTQRKHSQVEVVNSHHQLSDEQRDLIFSSQPAFAVALQLGRSVGSIHKFRHRRNLNPEYVPQGRPGGTSRWSPREDEILLALGNKDAAESLGRTYEAVKFRRKTLRRLQREAPEIRA